MLYRFHDLELDEQLYQLRRAGQLVDIEPKVFAVLVYLLHHRDRIIAKDELFDKLWPGQVVSETALTRCIVAARKAVGDNGSKQEIIETYHGRGYRFVAEVIEHADELAAQPAIKRTTPEPFSFLSPTEAGEGKGEGQTPPPPAELAVPTPSAPRSWSSRSFILAGVLLLVGIIVMVQYLSQPSLSPQPSALKTEAAPTALPLPNKPSIIVLPFVNMSEDPKQEYFSDGLTGELTSSLSRINSLFVIARTSAFTYKGKAAKVQDIGREMGVQYVLEGSVRKTKEQIRINIQLIEAASGGHVWAEHYERPLTDIFAVQDGITQKIVLALKVKLTKEEQARFRRYPTDNLEAYECVLRGAETYYRYTEESKAQARQLFEKAVVLDPQYAGAYAWLGWMYWDDYLSHNRQDPQSFERVRELAQQAIALDDSLPDAPSLLSLLHLEKQQPEQALAEAKRAITLDPNFADSYGVLSEILRGIGRSEEAIEAVKKALRLNPRGPEMIAYLGELGTDYLLTDRYTESITTYRQILARNPNLPRAYVIHAMQAFNYLSLWGVQLSQEPQALDKAREAAQLAVTLNETFPMAHTALGVVSLSQKQYDQALVELERAVALDGNYVCGTMLLAFGLSQIGRIEEAVQVGERALSLKVLPSDDRCLFGVADAFARAGRLEEAAALHQRLLKQFPNFLGSHLALAAIYSALGRDTEARAEAAEVLRLNPHFSLEVHRQRSPDKDPARLERGIAALRKAGLK